MCSRIGLTALGGSMAGCRWRHQWETLGVGVESQKGGRWPDLSGWQGRWPGRSEIFWGRSNSRSGDRAEMEVKVVTFGRKGGHGARPSFWLKHQLARSHLLNWWEFSTGYAVSGGLCRHTSGDNRLKGRKSWLQCKYSRNGTFGTFKAAEMEETSSELPGTRSWRTPASWDDSRLWVRAGFLSLGAPDTFGWTPSLLGVGAGLCITGCLAATWPLPSNARSISWVVTT